MGTAPKLLLRSLSRDQLSSVWVLLIGLAISFVVAFCGLILFNLPITPPFLLIFLIAGCEELGKRSIVYLASRIRGRDAGFVVFGAIELTAKIFNAVNLTSSIILIFGIGSFIFHLSSSLVYLRDRRLITVFAISMAHACFNASIIAPDLRDSWKLITFNFLLLACISSACIFWFRQHSNAR